MAAIQRISSYALSKSFRVIVKPHKAFDCSAAGWLWAWEGLRELVGAFQGVPTK